MVKMDRMRIVTVNGDLEIRSEFKEDNKILKKLNNKEKFIYFYGDNQIAFVNKDKITFIILERDSDRG